MDQNALAAQGAVTVSLEELKTGMLSLQLPVALSQSLFPNIGTVPFSTLEAAFGPASLGIILVKGLPSRYSDLRHRLLSYSSYLASLPREELGGEISILYPKPLSKRIKTASLT